MKIPRLRPKAKSKPGPAANRTGSSKNAAGGICYSKYTKFFVYVQIRAVMTIAVKLANLGDYLSRVAVRMDCAR